LTFGWSPARDAALDGSIRGTPTAAMPATVFTIWANNSAYSQSFELTITVLEELADSADEDDSINWGYICCFPLILLLVLCLLFVLVIGERKILIDAEPSNTLVKLWSGAGVGTQEDPLVLKPLGGIKPGSSANSHETITFTGLTVESIELVDFNQETNGRKFSMLVPEGNEIGARKLAIDKNEETTITMLFNDREGEPTLQGGEFNALLKIGKSSVYFSWTVTVKAQTDQDAKDVKKAKAEANADAKAAKALKAQADADAKAAKKTKAKADADAKAAREVKAQVEEEAKAAMALKAQADAEIKAAKDIKAEADEKAKAVEKAREKVEADAKKVAERAEELERIAKRAESIDFATLGVATIGEKDDLLVIKGVGPFIAEKLNALGIFTFEQVGNMTSEIEEQVNVAIEFFPGRIKRDQWAKQAKELHKAKK
ncbi:MAG: hypothetical protein L7S48_04230, partial [Candidatus Poseidonia sp.]|nr:hypothetical protein [Poseidonia sp.]